MNSHKPFYEPLTLFHFYIDIGRIRISVRLIPSRCAWMCLDSMC